jgi:hypothetical protein
VIRPAPNPQRLRVGGYDNSQIWFCQCGHTEHWHRQSETGPKYSGPCGTDGCECHGFAVGAYPNSAWASYGEIPGEMVPHEWAGDYCEAGEFPY